MCVNNLPKVATQWDSGATRDSNIRRRVLIPTALTTVQSELTVSSIHYISFQFISVALYAPLGYTLTRRIQNIHNR